jgi:hypothetical protein
LPRLIPIFKRRLALLRIAAANSQDRPMDKLGTWLAISAVAVGFVVLVWLLFADNPKDNKKKKMKK